MTKRTSICLNMIVKNESHIIHELFDVIKQYISTWVIVDTGSDDGTQDVIRDYMERAGIPGELHERPWKNFGHNRTEALALAEGHADYIWVIDADDILVGSVDLSNLTADVYDLLYANEGGGFEYWRPQIFRDGMPWRYEGVVHEFARTDGPCAEMRLEGDYRVISRRLGNRNADYMTKYARDRDLLLAEMERNPDDSRSAFYLAQSYFDLYDFANAAKWYRRRSEMGGWDEEVFMAMRRLADSMRSNGDPWPGVLDAYLKAWEYRPTRAEPLYLIAHHYRQNQQYRLGYFFAERAAKIPLPVEDILFVLSQVFDWYALETQAFCGRFIGKEPESFEAYRELTKRPNVPEAERQQFAAERDSFVSVMISLASSYPAELAQTLAKRTRAKPAEPATDAVTLVITARHDREAVERTLNSLLHCCTDIRKVNRFLLADDGLSAADRSIILTNYPFLEAAGRSDTRFTLTVEHGWQFFAPEPLIGRMIEVFDVEPGIVEVAVNYLDSYLLTESVASEAEARRTKSGGRYVLIDRAAHGPKMVDSTRNAANGEGASTASLDEVLCIVGP
jgi:glycosyltransferase involved in cell wall biosynthesis